MVHLPDHVLGTWNPRISFPMEGYSSHSGSGQGAAAICREQKHNLELLSCGVHTCACKLWEGFWAGNRKWVIQEPGARVWSWGKLSTSHHIVARYSEESEGSTYTWTSSLSVLWRTGKTCAGGACGLGYFVDRVCKVWTWVGWIESLSLLPSGPSRGSWMVGIWEGQ